MAHKVPGLDALMARFGQVLEFGVEEQTYTNQTRSLWHESVKVDLKPALAQDLDVDVLIVGGGFSGMSCARFLGEANPPLKIAVVERDFCGFGASGRNTGYCNAQVADNRFDEADAKTIKQLYELGVDATNHVLGLIEKYKIECGLQNHGFAYVAMNDAHMARLKEIQEVAGKYVPSAQMEVWDEKEAQRKLATPLAKGALHDKNGFNFNPFQYIRGVLDKVVMKMENVKVFENTSIETLVVDGTADQKRPVEAHCAGGHRVRASNVVLCTNAYSSFQGTDRFGVPVTVHTVVSQQLNDDEWAKLAEFAKNPVGWYSVHNILWAVRTTTDRRLAIATGFVRTYQHLHSSEEVVYRSLHQALNSIFPQFDGRLRCVDKWEGVIYLTSTSNPFVGTMKDKPHVMYTMAYNGHGVSMSNYSGFLIREMFMKNNNSVSKIRELPFVYIDQVPSAIIPKGTVRKHVVSLIIKVLQGMDRDEDVATHGKTLCDSPPGSVISFQKIKFAGLLSIAVVLIALYFRK